MTLIRSVPIILVFILLLTAFPGNPQTAAAQTACTQPLTSEVTQGSWSADCLSTQRDNSYARAYTFSVGQQSDVTIDLQSQTDTYLYLLSGTGASAAYLDENDDIDTDGGDYNSRITKTLAAGDYTIEATTYDKRATGDFTLTVAVTDSTAPTPSPSACVQPLTSEVTQGSWSADCLSTQRDNSYARAYTFSVSQQSDVTIDLQSQTDTYLYLLSGTGASAAYLEENDDIDTDGGNYNSRITKTLAAGDYTIEATTYDERATGDFTLTVAVTDSTAPPPSPTPSPTPPPASSECSEHITNFATYNRTLTSACASENRTAFGTHYARQFTFTLTHPTVVEVLLGSQYIDTYIFLIDDDGEVIVDIDDYVGRNAGFHKALQPGAYTIEVTTFRSARTGDFTITFSRPEFDALKTLYESTGGANWARKDNWLSNAPFSEWQGVQTDSEGRVTQVNLIANNLTGTIPSGLQDLTHLKGLYLGRNDLSGSIPGELGSLTALQVLMLSDNELTGRIPAQLGNLANLQELYLSRNQLSGSIPATLGRLDNLYRLHMAANELSGGIPAGLGDLTNLRQLSMSDNRLTGSIPPRLANLDNLTHLYLWGNELTSGGFFQRLGGMDSLQFLDIGGNRIAGAQMLPQLEHLDNLTGLGLHDSGLANADLLDYMHDLQALDLEFLNIRSNDLSDPQILLGLSRITTLQRLAINDNDFSGQLPRSMTALTLMRIFYFNDNRGLCAPADAEFQNWLTNIRQVRGDSCAASGATAAPAPASQGARAFAANARSPEHAVPEAHSLSLLESIQPGD